MARQNPATRQSPASKVIIDPSLQYQRQLHYMEKHSGLIIFKYMYWGMFLFILGLTWLTIGNVLGIANYLSLEVVVFAVFFMIYGLVTSLHLKLMKRYA